MAFGGYWGSPIQPSYYLITDLIVPALAPSLSRVGFLFCACCFQWKENAGLPKEAQSFSRSPLDLAIPCFWQAHIELSRHRKCTSNSTILHHFTSEPAIIPTLAPCHPPNMSCLNVGQFLDVPDVAVKKTWRKTQNQNVAKTNLKNLKASLDCTSPWSTRINFGKPEGLRLVST